MHTSETSVRDLNASWPSLIEQKKLTDIFEQLKDDSMIKYLKEEVSPNNVPSCADVGFNIQIEGSKLLGNPVAWRRLVRFYKTNL